MCLDYLYCFDLYPPPASGYQHLRLGKAGNGLISLNFPVGKEKRWIILNRPVGKEQR